MKEDIAVHVANLAVTVRDAKGRDRKLISGIHFEVPTGQFLGVIGASGCGKSTLIRVLAGQVNASAGRVLFAGHAVADVKEQYPLAIGYLPQFGAFHGELTVEESLRAAVALRLPTSVRREVKENWLKHIVEVARLQDILTQPCSTLSGGQMRRLALAEELTGDPSFLLLDELTSGLDPFSDREMMIWLRELAHGHGKTVILVTHAIYHLEYCDALLFLHQGRQIDHAPSEAILASHKANSVTDLFGIYQSQAGTIPPLDRVEEPEISILPLKTGKPPNGFQQFPLLLQRQMQLFLRDRGQIYLQLVLTITFPVLVAVFAMHGLPQVRQLTLSLQSNIVQTLDEQLLYLREAFHAASLVSGLAMFQVILLTLIGANNGAREIAKERSILAKELRAGLSPFAYVITKYIHLILLCLVQSFWMTWFVKVLCGFPGSLPAQFTILFLTNLAMSAICLAISAGSSSPERASLLAIYLVGFQLPLSGAALSLPDWLSTTCRPFIAAYWGWSGFLRTFESTRHFDIVKQAKDTYIAPYSVCLWVLGIHCLIGLLCAWRFVAKSRTA